MCSRLPRFCSGDDPEAPLQVVMAGDGPLASDIRRTVPDSPWLASRVHLPGYIHDPEHLLVDSDVVVLTSEAEGLPLVALEAMSLGVPVLASAVGGLSKLITNGRDGYLIEYSAMLPRRAADLLRNLYAQSHGETVAVVDSPPHDS
jgi:glycosyltransferase involved in cell wall biosynthesis